jgi:hypothetical protein
MAFNWCVVSLYTCAVSVFGFFIYLCHLNSYVIHVVCKEHDALKNVYDYIIGKLCKDGYIIFILFPCYLEVQLEVIYIHYIIYSRRV